MSDDVDVVSRIMSKAQNASRRELFAGLQAAVGGLIDAKYGRVNEDNLERVEEALDVGAPYGSVEHLDYLDKKWLLRGEI